MNNQVDVITGVGLDRRTRKSHWPARLDWAQSASGLFLGLFMWGHMAFVSTILISNDAMWWVTKMFEGQFLFGRSYPRPGCGRRRVGHDDVRASWLARDAQVSRQLPRVPRIPRPPKNAAPRGHNSVVGSGGDRLRAVFSRSVHLYQMLAHPGDIGPYESADRVWSGNWWPLYLVLLFAVELHGGVGLYRLAVKWGWFEGEDPNRTRTLLKRFKWGITVFFLALGLTTLAAYMKIGHEHRDRAGERYVPSYIAPAQQR